MAQQHLPEEAPEIGLIRAVRIGRKYQVDLESVKAHLRACASGNSDEN